MTKGIALIALLGASFALSMGNYWYTFGLWPKSWLSFFLFAMGNMLVYMLMDVVKGDK